MSPRLIQYWEPFRVGLIVILFLAAAWLRSRYHWDEATIGFISMENRSGEVSFIWNPLIKTWKAGLSSYAISYPRPGFPSSSSFASGYGGVIEARFAHWFLILIASLSWLTLLAWKRQQLRLQTKIEDDAEAEANGEAGANTNIPEIRPR